LGLTVQSGLLSVHPCIPKDWKSYRLDYRFHETSYAVTVSHIAAGETPGSTVDGVAVPGTAIRLVNDQGTHVVVIKIPLPS
jgi:cellobiose phosphorylase